MRIPAIRSLPQDQWPLIDRLAWERAINDDPLAQDGWGDANHWRPGTHRVTAVSYGLWLGWMTAEGALDPDEAPATRATPGRVRGYLDANQSAGLADHTCASRMQGLADALRVMAPDADIGFISRAASRLRGSAERSRDIVNVLIPPRELLDLGMALMDSAEQPTSIVPWKRAILHRDGLLIALLALRPIRVKNLAEIEIDRHLISVGAGHRLTFEAAEHKNGRPFSCSFPQSLESHLSRYLDYHRAQLIKPGRAEDAGSSLWLSQFGSAMPPRSVSQIVELRTLKQFGRRIGPHRQRHSVATAYAEAAPERISDVAVMLGHADLETSRRHYIHAKAINAGNALADAIMSRNRRRSPR